MYYSRREYSAVLVGGRFGFDFDFNCDEMAGTVRLVEKVIFRRMNMTCRDKELRGRL